MKKFLLAVIVIAGIAACNSPQEISTSDSTGNMRTTPIDSGSAMRNDTTMQGDTMKRDTMR